jgi:hypothetical protein
MKSGGELGAIEGSVPKWGGGGAEGMGDVLFGSESSKSVGETEWEVCYPDEIFNCTSLMGRYT